METSRLNKWQVRGAIAVIFVLGFIAGLLAFNIYSRSTASRSSYGLYEKISKQLDLSGNQKAEVEGILSTARAQLQEIRQDTQPRIDTLRKQTREKLKAVLTPKQWEQFQNLVKEERGQQRLVRNSGMP
jgi:hypothetical protein